MTVYLSRKGYLTFVRCFSYLQLQGRTSTKRYYMSAAKGKYAFGSCANSKGPDQNVQIHSLTGAFTIHSQNQWLLQNVWMESKGPDVTLHVCRIIWMYLMPVRRLFCFAIYSFNEKYQAKLLLDICGLQSPQSAVLKTQQTNHVETTSIQRWFNIKMLNQCWSNVMCQLGRDPDKMVDAEDDLNLCLLHMHENTLFLLGTSPENSKDLYQPATTPDTCMSI